MSEKPKIKIPNLSLGLLKNNFLIVVSIVTVFVFILNLIVWSVIQKTNTQIRSLQEKKIKIVSASKRIAKFTKDKLYLSTEGFERKVPYAAVPPVAAIQQAGIIISEVGAQNSLIVTEDSKGEIGSGGSSGSDDKAVVMVGSKTLRELEFSFKFESTYEDFMKILKRLLAAEPLIVVKGFTIERVDSGDALGKPIEGTPFFTIPEPSGDLRKLSIELKLSSFSEISPDQGIWTIKGR